MQPFTDFPTGAQSFQRPNPLIDPDPDTDPTLCVQFNASYLPYVLGALLQLFNQSAWDSDDRASLVLQREKINQLIYLFQIASPNCCAGTIIPRGEEIDDMTRLRVDCDCNVFIECCDGTEKQLVTVDGVNQPAQPGGGAPTPPPGGCTVYHARLLASGQYFVPAIVNAGDVITASAYQGAGSDDGTPGVPWYCLDGSQFFAGTCISGYKHLNSADPLPTANHMALICFIGATAYPLDTPLTVPSGVVNQQVVCQVNDAVLGNNPGSYLFDLQVCNNQTGSGCQTIDFKLTDGKFTVQTPNASVYAGGVGWSAGDWHDNDDRRGVSIRVAFKSTVTITSVQFTYDLTVGGYDNPSQTALQIVSNGDTNVLASNTGAELSDGTGQHANWSGVQSTPDLALYILSSRGSFAGAATITGVTICYLGTANPLP